MRYTLDRFEEGTAVVEIFDNDEISYLKVSADSISPEVKEGDILIKSGDTYVSDRKKTAEIKRLLYEKLRKIK